MEGPPPTGVVSEQSPSSPSTFFLVSTFLFPPEKGRRGRNAVSVLDPRSVVVSPVIHRRRKPKRTLLVLEKTVEFLSFDRKRNHPVRSQRWQTQEHKKKPKRKRNSPTTVASLAAPTDGKRSQQLVPSVGNGKGLAGFLVTVGWVFNNGNKEPKPNSECNDQRVLYWFWLVAFFLLSCFANVYKCTRVQCSSVGIYGIYSTTV